MNLISIVFWLVGTLIVVLGPLILIHELGHFLLAKWAGVRVEEFGFGFPPRMLRLWRGRGYIEIGGVRVTVPINFRLTPRLKVGSQVDAVVQRRAGGEHILRRLKVLDPDDEHPTPTGEANPDELHLRGAVTALERGTLYSLNWLPIGAFVKMTGEEDPSDPRSLAAQPKRWRIAIIAAGAVLNIIVALLLLVGAYASGIPDRWTVLVNSVVSGSAAAEAGLQPRDVILAIEGERIGQGTEHVQRLIQAAPERTVELTVLRGRELVTLTATPRRCEDESLCVVGKGFLGISMALWPDLTSVRYYTLAQAVDASGKDLATAATLLAQLPARLLRGTATPQEARPVSVVGASEILAIFLQQSIEWRLAFPTLQAAAHISLALGVGNLLPIPALDGGRILFVLIEAVRRRRISPEREALVHFVGLVVLIGLTALVMIQDIINPIFPWTVLSR